MYLSPETIPPDEVRAQMDRLLTSPKFSATDTLARLLRFVVQESLAGRGPTLQVDAIATQALVEPASLDTHVDALVRIETGRLRRALQRYYGTVGAGDPVVIEVPKGSYAPTFRYS